MHSSRSRDWSLALQTPNYKLCTAARAGSELVASPDAPLYLPGKLARLPHHLPGEEAEAAARHPPLHNLPASRTLTCTSSKPCPTNALLPWTEASWPLRAASPAHPLLPWTGALTPPSKACSCIPCDCMHVSKGEVQRPMSLLLEDRFRCTLHSPCDGMHVLKAEHRGAMEPAYPGIISVLHKATARQGTCRAVANLLCLGTCEAEGRPPM